MRFNDVIETLEVDLKATDNQVLSDNNLNIYKKLIEKYEILVEIDRLINRLNK